MRIPAFDLSRQTRRLEPELQAAIAEVALSGQFILGPAVTRFEQTFGEAFGVDAIGVANGS
ncbi:MAG: DegT/DnrJ/EryC1/StrS family aminotransferase, partial [Sulfobacillus sp.]|nr:DegT/DnrJ/EryC1/StrS family aminotransferase [Sulfobacillus sp.]